jgi:hypothetical protein
MPMIIMIDLAPEIQAEFARRAAARGVGIDEYAASLIECAAKLPDAPVSVADKPVTSREVIGAIETLRGFGKAHRLSLGGMTIRELRHEARP